MSEGSRSGVNCTRVNLAPIEGGQALGEGWSCRWPGVVLDQHVAPPEAERSQQLSHAGATAAHELSRCCRQCGRTGRSLRSRAISLQSRRVHVARPGTASLPGGHASCRRRSRIVLREGKHRGGGEARCGSSSVRINGIGRPSTSMPFRAHVFGALAASSLSITKPSMSFRYSSATPAGGGFVAQFGHESCRPSP